MKKRRFFNITVKFFGLFLLIIVPAVALLSYECYCIACDNINRKTEGYISDILSVSSINISNSLRDIDNISFSIKNDSAIQNGLQRGNAGPLEGLEQYDVKQGVMKAIFGYVQYEDRIRQTYVVDQNSDSMGISKGDNQYFLTPGQVEIVDAQKGASLWLDTNVKDDEMILSSQINSLRTQLPIGHIFVCVSEKLIRSMYADIQITEKGDIALIRSDGTILSHRDPAFLNQTWGEQDNLTRLVSGKQFFSIESLPEGRFYVAGCRVDKAGMYLVVRIPAEINREELNGIARSICEIGILILLLTVFVYFFAADRLFKPARELSEAIRLFGQGEFDSHFEVKSRDEIGIIAENFNEMADNINELIDQVYQEQILKQQAELKSLQMQINPHFLYNVLETINWMSRIRGIPEIGMVSKALGDLMRATIGGDDYIPVSQELRNIRNYLYIQSFRYGDRLNVWISIDDDILPYLVPKLILQPLIENSIVHGFEEKMGQGNIMIKGTLEKESIVFEIADDGSGMTEEKRQDLFRPVEPGVGERGSIGVRNVISRLKLYYGEKCRFEVESAVDEGTTIRIRIPLSSGQKKTS